MSYSRTLKAGILAMGQGSRALALLLIAAVLSRLLTKADYATYRQTMLAFTFVAPLFLLGLPQALLYFIPRDPEQARGRLVQNLVVLSAAGALLSIFLLAGGADLLAWRFNNPKLKETLTWLAAYPLLVLPIAALQPCLIATDRIVWAAGFTVISRIVLMAAVLVPVWYVRDPAVAIQGTVAAAAAAYLPGLLLMFRATTSGRRISELKAGIWEQLKYAVPLGLGAMIGAFNKNLGAVMVASSSSNEEFAVYINGALEIPMIALITGSTASIILPDLARHYAEGSFEKAVELFQRAAIKCGMILIPLTGLLALIAPALMRIIYGEGFLGSTPVFRIYLLVLPLRVVIFAVLFQAAGRSDLVLTRTVIGLGVMGLLCWLFIAWLGPIGAAVATVGAIVLYAYPFCIWTCSRLYRVPVLKLLPYKELLLLAGPMIFSTLVLGTIIELVPTANWIAEALLVSVAYVVMLGTIYRILGINLLSAIQGLRHDFKGKKTGEKNRDGD